MNIVNITPKNANAYGFFCIKDTKATGFEAKQNWFKRRFAEGLRIKLMLTDGRQAGFIEYVPAQSAWRPVDAEGYMFIHCIMVNPNKYKNTGTASQLINACISDAKSEGFMGVCTMTSEGPWIASDKIFEKNGFTIVDKRGRFKLMALTFTGTANARLLNWEDRLNEYKGWHLLYANQCPWHVKAVEAITACAIEKGIALQITEIESAEQAKKSPSGFGVFALIHNGRLLEDHYISKRRFETIIEKETT